MKEPKHNDRMLSGYKVVYRPDHFHHTLNDKDYKGYVYEHRYIVERYLNRPLSKSEVVHHKDGDKTNNDIENLEVLTRGEHTSRHFGDVPERHCVDCGAKLPDRRAIRCRKCQAVARRVVKERPAKEELLRLIENSSFVAVGKMFGVSDNAIRKWLKSD